MDDCWLTGAIEREAETARETSVHNKFNEERRWRDFRKSRSLSPDAAAAVRKAHYEPPRSRADRLFYASIGPLAIIVFGLTLWSSLAQAWFRIHE